MHNPILAQHRLIRAWRVPYARNELSRFPRVGPVAANAASPTATRILRASSSDSNALERARVRSPPRVNSNSLRFNGILKTFPRARALRSDSRVKKPIDFIDFIEFVFISRWLFEIENRGETLNVNSSLMELVEANSSLSNRLYTNICFWLHWFFRVSVLFCCFVDVVKEIKRKRRRRRNGALTGVRKIGARERREEFLSRQR